MLVNNALGATVRAARMAEMSAAEWEHEIARTAMWAADRLIDFEETEETETNNCGPHHVSLIAAMCDAEVAIWAYVAKGKRWDAVMDITV